jgi:tRNA(Ile)-lysidine synthase
MTSMTEPISSAEAARLFAGLAECPALLLAVSGGPDSTALMVLAARWRATLPAGPTLVAATIDHGLRPGSAKEAEAVKRLAGKLGVKHRIIRWQGKKPTTSIQAAARSARYRLLAAAAVKSGARHILTAHTLDDQAETILFRLARGSGLAGLAGMGRMTPVSAILPGCNAELRLVRPFLSVAKTRLIATLKAARVPFARDPSNRDPRFARSRLRKIMPLLAAEGLDAERLAVLARRMARAEAALDRAVADAETRLSLTQWSNSGPIMLDAPGFAALAAEVALRLLGRAVARVGDEGPVELAKLEALFDAICEAWARRPSRYGHFRRTLAGALATLDKDRLTIERAPARRPRPGGGRAAITMRGLR